MSKTIDFRSTGELYEYRIEPVDIPTTDIEQRLREGIGRSGISGGICADDCDAANRLMDEAADTIASLRSKLEEAEGARDRQLRAAYLAGFLISSPRYNSEYPYQGKDIEGDEYWSEAREAALASLREADHA